MEDYCCKYLVDAIDAALRAGEAILSIYNDPTADFEVEQKADHSPLTLADRRAHEVITQRLQHTPYPLLSEEGKEISYAERCKWETLWIVDPLDGTKEFIKRNGEFTVNIALVHHSIPIVGVIYIPVKQELYFAAEGLGAYKLLNICSLEEKSWEAWLAEAKQLPNEEEKHDPFVIAASRSHLSQETQAYIDEMKSQHEKVELISAGSSLKFCLLAEGRADVYPRFAPTMEWDTAAGHAIVRAANKEVYQVGTEEPLRYNKQDLLNPWFLARPHL